MINKNTYLFILIQGYQIHQVKLVQIINNVHGIDQQLSVI